MLVLKQMRWTGDAALVVLVTNIVRIGCLGFVCHFGNSGLFLFFFFKHVVSFIRVSYLS